MTGIPFDNALNLGGNKITNLAPGVASTDAATVGQLGGGGGGINAPAGDIGGTNTTPTVVSTHLTNPLPIAQGGTGSATGVNVYQAWQFQPESYGAKGDGRVLGDVVTTSGSPVITSASANFTSADVGKYIMIHGANGAAVGSYPVITTIISRQSATQVTLGANAGASVNNCPAVYGTDDTAAINSAITAANTYAQTFSPSTPGSGNYFFEIVFGNKIYILAGAPTQTTTPVIMNAQIPLPYPALNGSTPKLIIQLTGAGDAGSNQMWDGLIPTIQATALVSMLNPSNAIGQFGPPSVIGSANAGIGLTGLDFTNVKVSIKNLSVWCPLYTNLTAFDLRYVAGARAVCSSAHIFAPVGYATGAVGPLLKNMTTDSNFLITNGRGFRFPVVTNNDDSTMDDVAVGGYELAFDVSDHFTAGRMAAVNCDVIMLFNPAQSPSGISHGIFIQSMSAEVYNGGFLVQGGAGVSVQVDINWDAECTGVTYDLSDTGNSLHGIFTWRDPADASRGMTVNGAANLTIVNAETGATKLGGAMIPKDNALTFASTVAINAALGNVFSLTLTASTATLGVPTNPVDGQTIRIRVTQGTGGSFTLAYNAIYDFGAGSAPTLSTTAGKVDILAFEYVASISKWCYLGSGIGY
jgi:hypothetical protein